MCGWIFISKPAASPARSSIAWKPRLENGAPRSLMKTNAIWAARAEAAAGRAIRGRLARTAILESTDVQERVIEIDLIPAQIDQFRRT
jgi:hypothetical protein